MLRGWTINLWLPMLFNIKTYTEIQEMLFELAGIVLKDIT